MCFSARLGAGVLMLVACSLVPASLAQTFSVLHSFAGQHADGEYPAGGLAIDADGNLYGVTTDGGATGAGTIFKFDSSGNFTLLYSFQDGADGGFPKSSVVVDPSGNLYGTTLGGGSLICDVFVKGCGTVFKWSPSGGETVLHSFKLSDGATPCSDFNCGALIHDSKGNLYGTTGGGGSTGEGTIFKLSLTGKEKTLYTFCSLSNCSDGFGSGENLTRDAAGNLYGVTLQGGTNDQGVIFKMDSSGNYSVLYNFTGGVDGGFPWGGLLRDVQGNLYGTTFYGGNLACENGRGCGVVFRLDPSNVETVLYAFAGGSDGAFSYAGLIRDPAGNFYGTTQGGDATGDYGTVFMLDPHGKESVLHHFNGNSDGGYPQGPVVRDANGNLYGVATQEGQFGYGTLFKISP